MPESLAALVPYGADERVTTLIRTYCLPEHVAGRVVRVDRDRCLVVTEDAIEPAFAELLPAVGDWVGLVRGDRTVVSVVLPRRAELTRGGQVVAANVDVVFVVTGLDREVSYNRLERELVLAWDGGSRPVVVLNKQDRVEDPEAVADAVRERLGSVDVVLASAAQGLGISVLARELRPNRTAVLLGASGVGKSTLVNRLVGESAATVGEVREQDRRGRHTTTARSLLPVPGGGVLIDTPGVRSLALGDVDGGVALTFPEIDQLGARCRFRDCAHEREPDCAVTAAVEAGHVDAARLASWRKLQRELAFEARRTDPRLAAEERQRWKAIHKAVKGRNRP